MRHLVNLEWGRRRRETPSHPQRSPPPPTLANFAHKEAKKGFLSVSPPLSAITPDARPACCRPDAVGLVFCSANRRLRGRRAPVVNANKYSGCLSGACCQSVASGAAPSLDTPLVFEIKVDACNPGKWSLSSCLTPV